MRFSLRFSIFFQNASCHLGGDWHPGWGGVDPMLYPTESGPEKNQEWGP